MTHFNTNTFDPRSGFCAATATFHSKREPLTLPSDEFLDIATFIRSRPHSGHVAFIDAATGRCLTFSELWRAVDAVAAALGGRLGIRKGHVVLLLSPNSIFFPVALLATLSLGAVVTTTNPLNTSVEIRKQASDTCPVLAFTVRAVLPKLAGSGLRVVLLDEEEEGSKAGCPAGVEVVSTLGEMMRSEPDQSPRTTRERVRQDETATLLYSSGTTGVSKGVASSHRNLIAMAETLLSRLLAGAVAQIALCTVPMFHIYGLAMFASGLLASGSTTVVLRQFELGRMLDAIARYRVSYLPSVPAILVAMTNRAAAIRAKYDLSSLNKVICGGAPLSREVIEGFLAEFPGITVLQGYGMTESTAIASSTDSMEESLRYGTAGMLSASMEAKIVDPESGQALPLNRTGELWLRGPTIMKGYFRNPDATAATVVSGGWLRTGDLCYIDVDGYIFVVDRLKDLIKYKGYQVAPAELEALLITHPKITDAAVIPYPDKNAGQVPMAYAVREAGSDLSQEAVMEFIAKQVAPYKKIRRVAFVDTIPKTPSGKILRKDLIKLETSKL